jgi:hypothetical protein
MITSLQAGFVEIGALAGGWGAVRDVGDDYVPEPGASGGPTGSRLRIADRPSTFDTGQR